MYKLSKMIYIKAITPVHAGAGQTLENVDMPIQRETHSGIPKIEASSIKGSIKHQIYLEEIQDSKNIDVNTKKLKIDNELYQIFGPNDNGEDYASAINFTDAKLLFFPVRSSEKIFRLVTCPYVLNRWLEDIEVNIEVNKESKEDTVDKGELQGMKNISQGEFISFGDEENVILEEYIFDKSTICNTDKEKLKGLIEQYADIERVIIINDSDFIDFVTMYTEIITRNKINVETGTAEGTALFTEEYLPSESILYFNVLASDSFDKNKSQAAQKVIDYFEERIKGVFHVGGNTTIGKGFVKILYHKGGTK